MPTKTEIVADDGLHTATRTTIAKARGRADFDAIVTMLSASASTATFEGAIGDAERYWQTVPGAAKPTPLSKPWYRERILRETTWLRRIFTEGLAPQNLEWAIVRAVTLGAMLEDAVWRFGLGPAARMGGRVRSNRRAASREASATRKAKAADRDRVIRAAATEYRRRHPDHSVRTMAAAIARSHPHLKVTASTVRRRIALKKMA